MKKLMLGNTAIARGAYEAGVRFASAYPGTPSTEITQEIAKYNEVYAEWAPNEKVALESAIGASIAGARSLACMKHVGVNVAADPLFTFAYTGVGAGLLLVAADDPGMHSSQNEQDSRYYAMAAHIPMLEPSDGQEAKDYVKLAYQLSEKYDLPIMIRTTTRMSHSQTFVELKDREDIPLKPYVKDPKKYVMMPANAKLRHIVLEEKIKRLTNDSNSLKINQIIKKSDKMGIICSGVVYQYVQEALPDASVFKLGMVYPLPIDAIKKFSKSVDELIVIEELEPYIEKELKANGIKCHGKELFGVQGELSVPILKNVFYNMPIPTSEKHIPIRPPVMCAGCPHRGVYYVLSKLKLIVSSDIGCYTLGALPPLNAVDTVLCMGASVGIAHGFNKVRGIESNTVGVIGDSTFIHSGITGLINSVYNKSNGTLLILDNSTTGMTGHQNHPGTGITLKGEKTRQLNLLAICKACGVDRIRVIDSYDLAGLEEAIKEEMKADEMSVIIAQRPCQLLNKKVNTPFKITNSCVKCGACMKIGCPAIRKSSDGVISIDKSLCVGCGLCVKMCKFDAIKEDK